MCRLQNRGTAVSTHSRAEAAAWIIIVKCLILKVSTHSRAEAAAATINDLIAKIVVSTHSRAEAAAKMHKK